MISLEVVTIRFFVWFIITDKGELRGIHKYRCRCYNSLKRLKTETGGSKTLSHTGLSGEREYLRRGTRRKDENFERGETGCVIFVYY